MSLQVCPDLYTQGACITEDCPYKHDVYLCETCRVVCISAQSRKNHANGKKHRNRVRAQGCPYPTFCRLCNVPLGSAWKYPQHIQGRAHRSLEEELDDGNAEAQSDTHSEPQTVAPGQMHCEVCDISLLARFWTDHVTGWNHRKRERFRRIQAAFDDADKDKHGITVSTVGEPGLDFGFIEIDTLHLVPRKIAKVQLLLTTPGRIDISDVRLSSSKAIFPRPSMFSTEALEFPKRLWFQRAMVFNVIFDPRGLPGQFDDRLEIVFHDTSLYTQFVVTRSLSAVVGSREDWELLKPSAPYQPKRKGKQIPEKEIVRGIKPPQIADIEWLVDLPQAPIPEALKAALADCNRKSDVDNLKRTWLPQTLDSKTYGRHFKVLLHIEEAQMNIDIQRYDDEEVPMNPALPYYRLPVPGLAEKRPSVIVGDRILVQNKGFKNSGRWFEGFVHHVRQTDVDLKFHASFNSYRGQRYSIRFQLGRLPLRRMHQALGTAFTSDRVLFPGESHIRGKRPPSQRRMNEIRPVNKLIQTNPPQLLAVTTIVDMSEGSVPFVLFGPPGTGKTVTIVEAIRQILLKDASAHILACAPSNSAADLLAQRLKDNLSPTQLFRLNAASRSKENMPKDLENFTQSNSEGTFSVPTIETLNKFRVIVSTCISASVPYGVGMVRGHFSHIFVDEAGQACEPEAMIPIKTMADNKTNIILSGDPNQLGPIVRSSAASRLGLGISYLDRLMAREVYDIAKGHGISVVKLIKNWRSHESILEYPNEQFYKGELEPHGDHFVTHSLLRSHELVTPGIPIVFHAITGKDMREANSPSFFNIDEASLVKGYVDSLRTDQRLRLKDYHIGVITPYHAQVIKIRKLLKNLYSGVKVGSVEEFQGQERRVIIISTVRSSVDFVEYDIKHTLGFVASPRRFNVAITRAQALLIVIGDPSVLALDPLWRGFMNCIHLKGGWKGITPDWDTSEPIRPEGGYDIERRKRAEEDMENLVERTKTLILENSENLGAGLDEDGGHVEYPWREAD